MVGNTKGSANLGPKVFFIWGSLCCLSLAFAYFLVPEMKGLSLEQVDKMMEEVSPRKSAAWKPTTTFAQEMRRINAAKANNDYNPQPVRFTPEPMPSRGADNMSWKKSSASPASSPQPYLHGRTATPPPGELYERCGSPLQVHKGKGWQEIEP